MRRIDDCEGLRTHTPPTTVSTTIACCYASLKMGMGGDIDAEHVESHIPGTWSAVRVHGDGAVFTMSRCAAPVTL